MIRVTFSLDEATVAEIRRTAARLKRPQSQVVREAVAEYAARADRLHCARTFPAIRRHCRREGAPLQPGDRRTTLTTELATCGPHWHFQ